MWLQKTIRLTPQARGFHLVTSEIESLLPEIHQFKVGLCHLLLQHTSASLSINENADPTVRTDFESHVNVMVPENQPYYRHTYEGDDDMPAHIKSSLFGVSLQLPIQNGQFGLGTWQGIYLGEHRDYGGERRILVTMQGE
ncbi:secondary thiamine-phosphate synthase enzyme YjbQ [Catenovulum adriaticum]|uniref:Secondary thiamine-phosphate synthase enzyme YjbQ n=1 Tax=Catenovulum adriaticum TaxID=2984846 RepID=A0ABY7AKC3_9ALTE|nr:secondary thiamine-phosphate synthase enzyme YjbQ [Catenovulum sp. TS8]WAJ69722.1 secondary thiamine-phosphate synthase enzyme YjbQ [Catenovulum sp. TS8]